MRIIALMVHVLFVILLIPIYIMLKLMKWIGILVQMVSGWVFRTLGIIFFLTTVRCFLFQLEDSSMLLRMLISSIVVFMLPLIGDLVVAAVALLEGIVMLTIRYGI